MVKTMTDIEAARIEIRRIANIPKPISREMFSKLTPREQLAFVKNGGVLILEKIEPVPTFSKKVGPPKMTRAEFKILSIGEGAAFRTRGGTFSD